MWIGRCGIAQGAPKQPQSIFAATEYGFLDLSIEERRITAKLFNTELAVLETLLIERAQ